MDDHRARGPWVLLALGAAAVAGVAVWWALSPDRLAEALGLATRRYHRVLGYVRGVAIAALVVAVYTRWLGPWLCRRTGGRWPDPRRWYAQAPFWCAVVLVVGMWPPLANRNPTWRHLVSSAVRIAAVLSLVTYAYVRFARRARPGATTARRWAVNVGLTLLTLAWVLGGLEIYFRLFPQTDGLGVDRLGTHAWVRLYCQHLAYDLPPGVAPNRVAKLRTRRFAKQKPPGTFRIAVIGDSVVYGFGVSDPQDRFTEVLEQRLRDESGLDVEVINVGISGNDAVGCLEMLRGIAVPYACDLVIVVHNLNDLQYSAGAGPNSVREAHGVLRWLLEHSYAASYFIRYRQVQWQFKMSYPEWLAEQFFTPRHWERHVGVLATFAAVARRANIPVVFVQHPFLAVVDDYPDCLCRVHARLDALARRLGFRSLDFLSVFDGQDGYALMINGRDRHPNERAHRLMADYLYRGLRAGGLLPGAVSGPSSTAPTTRRQTPRGQRPTRASGG